MSVLEAWLFEATKVLLAPVVTALLILAVFALVALGGFIREALDRRVVAAWGRGADAVTVEGLVSLGAEGGLPGLWRVFAQALPRAGADGAATDCELAAARRVSRLNLVARAGPTLGLMATLIPMGPALLALADDDVAGLARSLAVAFTATVCGLFIGLVCAAMASVRRHWYTADLARMDELITRLARERP